MPCRAGAPGGEDDTGPLPGASRRPSCITLLNHGLGLWGGAITEATSAVAAPPLDVAGSAEELELNGPASATRVGAVWPFVQAAGQSWSMSR